MDINAITKALEEARAALDSVEMELSAEKPEEVEEGTEEAAEDESPMPMKPAMMKPAKPNPFAK